jgi:hypothetical protein
MAFYNEKIVALVQVFAVDFNIKINMDKFREINGKKLGISAIFKWFSKKETIDETKIKARSSSMDSAGSFDFIAANTFRKNTGTKVLVDTHNYEKEKDGCISSKYRLLPANDSPPAVKKAESLSAVKGPLLPCGPILPKSTMHIVPHTRSKQTFQPNQQTDTPRPLNALCTIGDRKVRKTKNKRKAPEPPTISWIHNVEQIYVVRHYQTPIHPARKVRNYFLKPNY